MNIHRSPRRSPAHYLRVGLWAGMALLLTACGSNNDSVQSPAESLQAQFGDGDAYITVEGMQALLDYEDNTTPVTLVQIMNITDPEEFALYEQKITAVLARFGATRGFASRAVAQLLGDRSISEVRVTDFPDVPTLIEAIDSEDFREAMGHLFAASDDHAWVLGRPTPLPFTFSGGYFDPTLLNQTRASAVARLLSVAADNSNDTETIGANPEILIDMIVSDSPEPFYMVNYISYREQAVYADGRETDLTGVEANAIYGNAIIPQLLAYNSGPILTMPVDLALTEETVPWNDVAIVRYASRDAFLNIFALNPASDEAVIHKDAGVEETIVYATEKLHDTPPEPVNGVMYGLRYCEVLLTGATGGGITVDVWGTPGLNRCPQEQWDALDAQSLAAENGAIAAFLNGPRYFVVDWSEGGDELATGAPRLFGDIAMRLLTTVTPPENAGQPYGVARVVRDNSWHFVAGREIYQLHDPEGNRYVMQSFSRIVDAELDFQDLPSLGERLELPPGWTFSSQRLTETLSFSGADGIAEVLQDELRNSYQRVP